MKIVFAGECNVGKSSLIVRYFHKIFLNSYLPTLGKEIRPFRDIHICDLGGNSKDIIEDVDIAVLVFRADQRKTFDALKKWNVQLKSKHVIVVANMCDLVRPVCSYFDLATELGWDYIETSAKSGLHVNFLFSKLINTTVKEEGWFAWVQNQIAKYLVFL